MSDQPGAGLPQNVEPIGNLVPEIGGGHGLPPSLQILLNEGLYNRIKQLSGVMSKARGLTPVHLIDKAEACFAIINMALDWKLSPHFVARHTYQTPGGAIGFDGALVQAALENSGRFIGAPQMEYRGDWENLVGKFELKSGVRGGTYPAPTWTSKDAIGLGIIVRWQVKGEPVARAWPGENNPFWLHQCFPLNSPLWATDPKTQIAYLAIRRFANLTSPGILGAAAFDQDELIDASERAVDVTPEPRREQFNATSHRAEPVDDRPEYAVFDNDGMEHVFRSADRAFEGIAAVLREAVRQDLARLDAAWENNQATIEQLTHEDPDGVNMLASQYMEMRDASQQPQRSPPASETAAPINQSPNRESPIEAPAAATAQPSSGEQQSARLVGADRVSPDPPPAAEPPARPSRTIVPPLKLGKSDFRVWAIALMGPKIRQQRTSDDLATLLGDNAEHMEAARQQLIGPHAQVFADLQAMIDAQWKTIG